MAHRLSAVVLIVGFISNVHILIFITIYHDSCQTAPGTIYSIFIAAYIVIVTIVLPYILMLILCILTFVNMKRTKRRVVAASNTPNLHPQKHRFEFHIIMVCNVPKTVFFHFPPKNLLIFVSITSIIVLQVIVSSALLSLRIGSYIYSTLTIGNLNKTMGELVAEDFALQLGVALYYFSFANIILCINFNKQILPWHTLETNHWSVSSLPGKKLIEYKYVIHTKILSRI